MITDFGEQLLEDTASTSSGGTVAWLFGRGLSVDCGLRWAEPYERRKRPRDERIESIKRELRVEMELSPARPVYEFLMLLERRTSREWSHLFITTNWDYLLQREVNAILNGREVPKWLHFGAGSHVHHVNGTVEEETQHRSAFILEDDSVNERVWSVEANYAFNYLLCARTIVMVGMSFECEPDRYLLRQLNRFEDWMPIGESHWIIVNPGGDALERVSTRIEGALPHATVTLVPLCFSNWRNAGCPELKKLGVLI